MDKSARWARYDAQWQEATIEHTTLRWVEAGSGTPMLLLHGYGGNARWWCRNLNSLGGIRRVYALDIPGFGNSQLRGRFTFTQVIEYIVHWMAATSQQQWDVVGHSMGGLLAAFIAARAPEKVSSLILAAPVGIPFTTGIHGIMQRALHSWSRSDLTFTPIIAVGALQAGPRILWQAVQQIKTSNIQPVLETIATPTLILWGDRDRLIPVRHADVFLQHMPHAQLQVLKGAGHNLIFEDATRVNRAIQAFVRCKNSESNPYQETRNAHCGKS